jgi:hypothetical protein
MHHLPCCPKKKVVPQAPVTVTTEVTAPKIVPKEKPYGYVELFAGKFLISIYFLLFLNQSKG